MKHTQILQNLGAAVVAAITFILSTGGVLADIVKLKDGTTIEGVITFPSNIDDLETSDMVKIRVQRPGSSISETKTVLRPDVAEVIKSAPDDVEFAKLQGYLPTPSLMTTSQYQTLIEQGPQDFLKNEAFLDSKHRPEVEKIKKELDDEMAKVNMGYIKIKGEWISPKSRRDFKEAINARIQTLSLEQQARQGDFVSALRSWGKMEENYFGTPSYVESVKIVQQFLPAFGQQLQRMVADVDYNNEQFQLNLAKMPEQKRAPVIEARKQEEAKLKQRFDADKADGVRWHQYNKRDKEDLTAYIQMVSAEIEKLKAMDLLALEEQSKQLVKVDELLAEGKIGPAKELLRESTGLVTSRGKGKSSKKTTSPYGSKGKGSRSFRSSNTVEKSSYPKALQEKIAMMEKAIADKIARDKDTAEGERARDAIRVNAFRAAPDLDVETIDGQTGSNAGGGDITKLFDNTPPPEKKEPAASKKPTPKKKPVKKSADEDEEEDEVRKPVSSGGFRWSFQKTIISVAVLMAIALGLMKMLGIGGAKE